MKRAMAMVAFLGLVAFSGALHAQEMGEDEKPGDETEQPKKDDTPAKPERKRQTRGDRSAFQEIGRILRAKDADGDSKLSQEEFGDADLFKTLDTDEDGSLTLRELIGGKDAVIEADKKEQAAVMQEEFSILDRDDSGKLSKDELGKEFEGLLETGDTDKDGSLNLEEFSNARKPGDSVRNNGDRPERGDILGQLDKDGDGKISKDEAPARLKENFDKVDKDGDGFLSKEEIEGIVRDRMKRQRPGAKPETPKQDDSEKKENDKNDNGSEEDEF